MSNKKFFRAITPLIALMMISLAGCSNTPAEPKNTEKPADSAQSAPASPTPTQTPKNNTSKVPTKPKPKKEKTVKALTQASPLTPTQDATVGNIYRALQGATRTQRQVVAEVASSAPVQNLVAKRSRAVPKVSVPKTQAARPTNTVASTPSVSPTTTVTPEANIKPGSAVRPTGDTNPSTVTKPGTDTKPGDTHKPDTHPGTEVKPGTEETPSIGSQPDVGTKPDPKARIEAEARLKAAQQVKSEAESALKASQVISAGADQVLTKARADLEAAQAKLGAAQEELGGAKARLAPAHSSIPTDAVARAEKAAKDATERLNAARAKAEAAQAVATTAAANTATAQDAYTSALKALKDAEAASAEAKRFDWEKMSEAQRLDYVNHRVAEMTNEYRSQGGLEKLPMVKRYNALMTEFANWVAEDPKDAQGNDRRLNHIPTVDENIPGATREDKERFLITRTLGDDQIYAAAENMSYRSGYGVDSQETADALAKSIFTGLTNSKGHNRNFLNPSINAAGSGLGYNKATGVFIYIWRGLGFAQPNQPVDVYTVASTKHLAGSDAIAGVSYKDNRYVLAGDYKNNKTSADYQKIKAPLSEGLTGTLATAPTTDGGIDTADAQEKVAAAQAQLDSAKQKEVKAVEAATVANSAVESATTAANSAKADLESKTQQANEAQAALITQAQTAVDAAQSRVTTAQSSVEDAKKALGAAETNKQAADAVVKANTAKLAEAEANVATAEKEVAATTN